MCVLNIKLLLCSEGNNELGYTCSFLVDYCIIYSHTQNAREKIGKETQAQNFSHLQMVLSVTAEVVVTVVMVMVANSKEIYLLPFYELG